jgi:hypothetical protein
LLPKATFKPAALVDERGCRRDIRSNGCTVIFRQGSLWRKAVRQKKEVFFIGADPKVRNFTGALCRLRFGPDVFADALVPRRGIAPGALISQKIAEGPASPARGLMRGTLRQWLSLCQMAR